MKKHLLFSTILFCAFLSVAKAQTDSTKYDLGRITLQKKFTQSVTIKAADLEKMPFSNLSDAIGAWLNGVYGGTQTYASVIDGNLNDDVNAYSIYDIEEITLVQNAATMLNGLKPSQLLLVIKTRRNRPGKSGVVAAGQTNVINMHNTDNNYKSTTNFYNQYYISAYRNSDHINAGVSADFQHDALAMLKTPILTPNNPYNFNRFKFNGYLDVKIGKSNTVSVNAGYVPQADTYAITNYSANNPNTLTLLRDLYNRQDLWHADIKLHSAIIKGLSNDFSAGVQHYHLNAIGFDDIGPNSPPRLTRNSDSTHNTITYFIKDNLSYKISKGKFSFEPNLNFTYKHATDSAAMHLTETTNYTLVETTINTLTYRQKMYLLTPSLAINYADAVILQGGFQYILNGNKYAQLGDYKLAKLYPFASATINILPSASDTHLALFGSYAKTTALLSETSASQQGLPENAFNAFLSSNNVIPINFVQGNSSSYPLYQYNFLPTYNPYQTYNQIQVGTSLSLLKNKITLSYNYNIQQYHNTYPVKLSYLSSYITIYTFPDARLDQHRLGLDVNLLHSDKFNWSSGLNATIIKYDLNFHGTVDPFYIFIPDSHMFTGGFVNRLNYKQFFAAIDLLYRFHQEQYSGKTITGHFNSFDVQNLYAGYRLNAWKLKNLEVFANARNLLQNKQSDITDNRRFYGAGFKLGL